MNEFNYGHDKHVVEIPQEYKKENYEKNKKHIRICIHSKHCKKYGV